MTALLPLILVIVISCRYPGAGLAGLFFGFPATLLSGTNDVTSIYTAVVLFILILLHLLRRGQIHINSVDVAMSGVLGVITLSTLWSPSSSPTSVWIAVVQPIVAVYCIAKLSMSYGNCSNRANEFMITSAVLSIAYSAMISMVADVSGARLQLDDVGNVAVGLTQAFVIGSICGLAMLLDNKRFFLRIVGLLAILTTFYAIVLTGTRGAFIAVLAGWSAQIYMKVGLKGIFTFAALVVPLGILTFSTIADRISILAPAFRVFRFETYGATYDASSIERIWRFDAAKDLVSQSPVWGMGLGSYEILTPFAYPHNFFLEIAAQTGLIGIFAVCILITSVVKRIRNTGMTSESSASVALCAIILAGFIHQQVSFSLPNGKPLFLVGAVAGYSLKGLMAAKDRSLSTWLMPKFMKKYRAN